MNDHNFKTWKKTAIEAKLLHRDSGKRSEVTLLQLEHQKSI